MSKIWRLFFLYSLLMLFMGSYVERAELNSESPAMLVSFLDNPEPNFLAADSYLNLPVDSRKPASAEKMREVETKAFKVQLNGNNKEIEGPVEVTNLSNGYTATVFTVGSRYQTDYIHLNGGVNEIYIVWPSGVKEWVRVNSLAQVEQDSSQE